MKKIKSYILIAFSLLAIQAQAAIQLTWSSDSGETKKIYSITGSYTINWGDGTTDANSSHTYSTAGDYTVLISGTVSSLDLRGDDSSTGASGITSFSLTEQDSNLGTLNIWGNDKLQVLDLTKAIGLTAINATADPISSLDLSKNTLLTSIDLKMCSSLSDLTVAESYASLKTIDINNSAITACSLNALYDALPQASGTIYAANCTGDATSNSSLATAKGWTFSNGGTGDGSAVCQVPLTEVTSVESAVVSSGYSVSWTGVEGAESYSVKVIPVNGDQCEATFYYTTGESVVVNPGATASDYQYYVYSIDGKKYVESGPYTFSESSATETIKQDSKYIVYSVDKDIHIIGTNNGESLKLFNMNGVLLTDKIAKGNEVIIKAAIGDYLLSVGSESHKVIVK